MAKFYIESGDVKVLTCAGTAIKAAKKGMKDFLQLSNCGRTFNLSQTLFISQTGFVSFVLSEMAEGSVSEDTLGERYIEVEDINDIPKISNNSIIGISTKQLLDEIGYTV